MQNIAIVTGGYSSELPVSLKTAATVASNLDKSKFSPFIITVEKNKWFLGTPQDQGPEVDKNDFSVTLDGKKIKFDCVFMTIHGSPGEDGKLPAYFDMLKIPYTSSNVLTSSLTFNKHATKIHLGNTGLNTQEGILMRKGEDIPSKTAAAKIGFPCFVKPNSGGSSIGITKVKQENELENALKKAFDEDDEVLVEKCIEGVEITAGILKTKTRELIFPLTELVPKTEFFDYAAKYEGASEEITPARLPEKAVKDFARTSSYIYDLLQCRGIVRIDYFYDNGKIYFMEINTVPGMTEASLIPQQIRAMGMSLCQVFTLAIEDAIFSKSQ